MRLILLAALAVLVAAPLEAAMAQTPPPAAEALVAGEAFLSKNKTAPGVVTLPSGLQYKVVKAGPAAGGAPKVRDTIKVHYEGKLLNGTVFDSSIARGTPADMPLRNLIPAWIEAVQLMRPGDEWIIWTPPALAYGEREGGPIPPNSVLEFRLNLIDFTPAPPVPDGATFLSTNKTAPGVITLPSGLQYKVLNAGPATGGSPTTKDLVAVHYEGRLLDGTVFDSTRGGEPGVFELEGLIPAWVEALQRMHPGDQWMLWAPPELAYGDKGDETIPANSVLEFRMQLMAFRSIAEIEAEEAAEAAKEPPPKP